MEFFLKIRLILLVKIKVLFSVNFTLTLDDPQMLIFPLTLYVKLSGSRIKLL